MDFVTQIEEMRKKDYLTKQKEKEELEMKEFEKLAALNRQLKCRQEKVDQFIMFNLKQILVQAYLRKPTFAYFDICACSSPFGTSFYLMLGSPADNGHDFICNFDIPFTLMQSLSEKLYSKMQYINKGGDLIEGTSQKIPSYTVNCIYSDFKVILGKHHGFSIFRFILSDREHDYHAILRKKARKFINKVLKPEIMEKSSNTEYSSDVRYVACFLADLKYASRENSKSVKLKYGGDAILEATKLCKENFNEWGIKAAVVDYPYGCEETRQFQIKFSFTMPAISSKEM